jgi:hypothetical protein
MVLLNPSGLEAEMQNSLETLRAQVSYRHRDLAAAADRARLSRAARPRRRTRSPWLTRRDAKVLRANVAALVAGTVPVEHRPVETMTVGGWRR